MVVERVLKFARGSADGAPEGEGEVLDVIDDLGAARDAQGREMGAGPVEADHALVLGHRYQKWAVGIAVAQDRVDLEDGGTRV